VTTTCPAWRTAHRQKANGAGCQGRPVTLPRVSPPPSPLKGPLCVFFASSRLNLPHPRPASETFRPRLPDWGMSNIFIRYQNSCHPYGRKKNLPVSGSLPSGRDGDFTDSHGLSPELRVKRTDQLVWFVQQVVQIPRRDSQRYARSAQQRSPARNRRRCGEHRRPPPCPETSAWARPKK